MKTKFVKAALLMGLIALFVFPFDGMAQKKKKGNPYHTKGTKEYTEVTSKLIGEWNIVSFAQKKDEKIGNLYEKATVEFGEFDENGNGGVAIFRFYLPKATIDERIASWNKEGVTVVVDSYVVEAKVDYKISEKGVLVYLENQFNVPDIKGSGDQLENFKGAEITFISSQSAMKEAGGVSNLVGAQIMKAASGTHFLPSIPTQVNYKNLEDTSCELITLQKINFKLTK